MKQEIDNYLQGLDMPKPKAEKNNLSYCTTCRTVYETYWGFHYGSMEKKHHDMPTYGLKRESCNECKPFCEVINGQGQLRGKNNE